MTDLSLVSVDQLLDELSRRSRAFVAMVTRYDEGDLRTLTYDVRCTGMAHELAGMVESLHIRVQARLVPQIMRDSDDHDADDAHG